MQTCGREKFAGLYDLICSILSMCNEFTCISWGMQHGGSLCTVGAVLAGKGGKAGAQTDSVGAISVFSETRSEGAFAIGKLVMCVRYG